MNIRFLTFILLLFISVQLNAQERRIQEDGKTYVIHVVVKGETIFSLSEAYAVDKKELLGANPDLIFGLKTGQELKIPVAETSLDKNLSPAQKEELPSFHTYRVKRKDGLHFIANKYDVEVEDILKYNPDVEEDGLQKRMILLIPDAADLKRIREAAKTEKRVAASKDTFRVKTHQVKGNETLYSISKKYGVSIASILNANPEANKGLPIGMMLTIPEKEIRMTTETVPQSGFFTHLVESGETFWGLERKYHVTRDVLEKYNPALENGLLAGLRIKIPVSEKLPEFDVKPLNDGQFQKHHVLRGETLYSISNKYGVKISEIKKINPVLNYRGLMAGETILITDVVAQEPLVTDKQDSLDKEVFIERSENKVAVSEQAVRIIPRSVPESCKPDLMAAYEEYDVALLLPLYLPANDTVNRVPMTKEEMLLDEAFMSQVEDSDELPEDTFKIRDEEIIYPRSENFVHFYEGVLLAVDSLQKAGMKIQLHVFDTNQEQAVVDSLVQLDVFRELDLIIGPVFPNLQQPVADFAYKNRIPMVSPLSSSGNFEDNNPYYFKVNPTKDYLVRETADFIGEEYFNKNLIVLEMGEYKHLPEATLVDLCREKFFSNGFLNADREVHFHEYNFNREGYWGLRRILSKDRENVFIIPSETEAQISVAISNVNSLSEDFPVTLVGMSNFQRYHSIQPEYLHHTKLHLLSPYFVDYNSSFTNRFIEDFRSNFSAEPNQFSFQGYDIAFYFMSALFNYGKDFNECLGYHRVKLNQAEFYFDRVSRFGGYMNRGLFVLNYTKDFKVAIDGVAGVPGLMFAED
ncbi:LysM peptidoglycan-binding domain-containing protein [Sunxiuqinia indica]|uniref:LysM peptidoglycan-binding domain-containing protein n=1 Tax=Sunxiuqinia indica TaxID=2692584 RepID=UPI001356B5E2|nr:LysM peptidoglycan-binding domain-containing protein [Sunxiuqinia indica]